MKRSSGGLRLKMQIGVKCEAVNARVRSSALRENQPVLSREANEAMI